MRECRTSGSVRGVPSNGHPYRNRLRLDPQCPCSTPKTCLGNRGLSYWSLCALIRSRKGTQSRKAFAIVFTKTFISQTCCHKHVRVTGIYVTDTLSHRSKYQNRQRLV